jgi:general secretion pathway protein D
MRSSTSSIPKRFMPSHAVRALAAGMALTVGSCANLPQTPITRAMDVEKNRTAQDVTEVGRARQNQRESLTATDAPTVPVGATISQPFTSGKAPEITGQNVSVNFEGIRLPAFVNTVFGEILKLPFEIDSALMARDQLVTLRTAEPMEPAAFYEMVSAVLSNYGISVVYQNNIYRIVESSNIRQNVPTIIRSRALPATPGDMRPIFYFMPLRNISTGQMTLLLETALKDRVVTRGIPGSNGLILLGTTEDVAAAVETIQIMDQPHFAGYRSLRISPAFWSAQKLAVQLAEVLSAEGYNVAMAGQNVAAIRLIPIEALNTIIVMATSEENLAHILRWATDLDQPSQTVQARGVYYHQVFNTKAVDIASVIQQLGTRRAGTRNTVATSETQTTEPEAPGGTYSLTVDEPRNAIIFQGSAEEYAQFRTLVQQMDRAPLEVLIEATVAEVTLDQSENLGILFNFDDRRAAAASRSIIRSDDGGLFVNLIRDSGQLTATLNALADKNKVTILSSPRLVATSGKTATMQVGTQVPIITTQQTAPDGAVGGTSTLLQDVQYRNTGVILNIEPTVNSNRRVELIVSQEVSDAQSNNISDVQSPLILTRSFNTTLSLDDGETVLLGGLISENYSTGDIGIPVLKDIPLLGNLFKSSSKGLNKTELIVLLTPYIIDGPETSRAVRDAFRSQLGNWARAPIDNETPALLPTP